MVALDPAMVTDFKNNLIYFATFTNNWFVHLSDAHRVILYHAWSLATEEQFYLLWPLVLFFVRSPAGLMAVAAGLLLFDQFAGYLVTFGIVNLGIDGNAAITSMATPICLGVLAAIAPDHRRLFEILAGFAAGFWSPLLWAGITVALIVMSGLPEILTHAVMTLLIISVVTRSKHALSPIMNHSIVEYIGRISYGMYIMHMAAVNAVRLLIFPNMDPNSLAIVAAGFAVTILAAAVSFHFYEKPFLSLRHRFKNRQVRPA